MREPLGRRPPRIPAPLTAPVLVYGAGSKGRQIAAFLRERGLAVLGFADANARAGETRDGWETAPLEQWPERCDVAATTAVVAIHNPAAPLGPVVRRLAATGFARVVTLVELYGIFPGQLPDHYWLTHPGFYVPFADEITRLDGLLADEPSRDLLRRVVDFRLSGDYDRLPPPSVSDQYHPRDLPRWPAQLRLVDCGAFEGDSLRALEADGYVIDAVAAFEPDPASYGRLVTVARGHREFYCFPCGVGGVNGSLPFASGMDGASHFSPQSSLAVPCVRLDDALGGFRPNLVKMDVEGAEREALAGAERMIATHRPALAICVYHRPADLWEIPRLIAAWNLGYRLALRSHAHSDFDLVLYAVPG